MSQSKNTFSNPSETWLWSRDRLGDWQVEQFNRQLAAILPQNQFYAEKLTAAGISLPYRLRTINDLQHLPFTTKSELSQSSQQTGTGISRHQTFSAQEYSRVHRTSGTHGQPLMILDTAADWQWWSDTWQHVLQAAEIDSKDRVFLAFSFGPFIGFWSAHQACVDRGAMVIPGGGLSTLARLEFMRQSAASVVCCTPSYALHMAEVAKAENFSMDDLEIDRLIVAGESGGSVPEVRNKIAELWQADVIDHAGATEIGPWGFGLRNQCGLHIAETSFIAEVIPLANMAKTGQNHFGELVLTSLGRLGAPVIRYRTGDVVRVSPHPRSAECCFSWLPEGVIGRADDMVTIRGVNIFPSSIDSIVRSQPNIGEYQVQIWREGQLDQLSLTVEASPQDTQQLEKQLSLKTGLRIGVQTAPFGTLPRSDTKSKRWIDRR